jgi:hypothetical protein
VKVHVFFSDQPLSAGSLAQDLYERKGDPSFHPIDLRLPGRVFVQTLEFRPRETEPATEGGQIGAGGAIVQPQDGGEGKSEPPPPGATRGTPQGDAMDAGGAPPGTTAGVPLEADAGTQ